MAANHSGFDQNCSAASIKDGRRISAKNELKLMFVMFLPPHFQILLSVIDFRFAASGFEHRRLNWDDKISIGTRI